MGGYSCQQCFDSDFLPGSIAFPFKEELMSERVWHREKQSDSQDIASSVKMV